MSTTDEWGRYYTPKARDLIRREMLNLHSLPTLILGVLDEVPRSAAETAELVVDDLSVFGATAPTYTPQQVSVAMRQLSLVEKSRDSAGVLRYSCPYEDAPWPS